ncbi:MAG: hypothetical protein JKY48_20420 [Flavobacteriales bacterium]|nr:hypothetical protein [Flavobacteriales bacterium]
MKLILSLIKALFYLCVIVFGIKTLKEPDIYWMLRTGEWMVENGRVVSEDLFSFTNYGTPWINVKWLFELILYGVERIGGPELTPVLQCFVYCLVFYFLEKRIKLLSINEEKKYYLTLISIVIFLVALIAIEFRMLARPEMTSHLLMVVYLFLFEKHRKQGTSILWWLIPLQIFWTNMHEAFGMGLVIIVGFLLGEIYEVVFHQKKGDKKLMLISILSILAISINPRGIIMILHPFEILSQVDLNKYTNELAGFQDLFYWKKEAFLMLSFFILCAIPLLRKFKKEGYNALIKSYGAGWLGLSVLFFYLAFTAYRNIPFFVLFSTPFAVQILFLKFNKWGTPKGIQLISSSLLIALVVLYLGIVSNTYYELSNSRDTYGLMVDKDKNPTGVVDFMNELKVDGQGFSDYLTSSYLMWELRPDFKTFIDLRDLDVFSNEFFDSYFKLYHQPEQFDQFDKKYDFNYAVVFKNDFTALHIYLDKHENWEMVYVDAVAALYLKKTDENIIKIDSLIEQSRGTFYKVAEEKKVSELAQLINVCFNPFYKQESRREGVDYDLIGGQFFVSNHDYNPAIIQLNRSIEKNGENQYNLFELAKLYLEISQISQADETRIKYTNIAINYFNKLTTSFPNYAEGWKGKGILALNAGNKELAISSFKKSLNLKEDKETRSFLILAEFSPR